MPISDPLAARNHFYQKNQGWIMAQRICRYEHGGYSTVQKGFEESGKVLMISHVFPLTTRSVSNKTCLLNIVYFALIIHRDQSF